MAYLTQLATQFQRLVFNAMYANHGTDDAFEKHPRLRIAPAVMARMKAFSDEMAEYGQTYAFMPRDSSEPSGNPVISRINNATEPDPIEVLIYANRKEDDPDELIDILHPRESLPHPKRKGLKKWLHKVFEGNRGFELGTFNPSLLATCMKKQSSKWSAISLGFNSDMIVIVHSFIDSALTSICSDREVREALIGKLTEELIRRYQKAITTTKFLLEVESSDAPMTLNHYFNDNLQKR